MIVSGASESHHQLLKSQKAGVGDAINQVGLDINEFAWTERESSSVSGYYVPVLQKKSTEYEFVFDREIGDFNQEYWSMRYSPGPEDYWTTSTSGNWLGVITEIKRWTRLIAREEAAEDPWSIDGQGFSEDWKSSNEKFTPQEIKTLDVRLEKVQQFLIEKSSQQTEVLEDIKSGIEYLKSEARHATKREWVMLFVGWFITRAADWSVTNVHWHEIIKILVKGTTLLITAGK